MNSEYQKFAVKHLGMNSMVLNDYQNKFQASQTPYVLEEREMRVTQMDVFSRMMMDRVIFLGSGIDDQVSNIVISQLLFLQSLDPEKDIQMYINSPGGSVYAGLGIYDTMQLVTPDVATICTSIAASMGAVLMVAGAKGKRSALKHSRIMIHQPMGGVQSGTQASDMEINLKEMLKLKNELYEIISNHSGQEFSKVEKDSDRDFWMTSTEAKSYGMIDEIL